MTEAQQNATLRGWEMIKIHLFPQIFLWLAEDGWEGAWEIEAIPAPPPDTGAFRVYAHRWTGAALFPDYSPN